MEEERKNYKAVKEGNRYYIADWSESYDAFIVNDGIYGYYSWDTEDEAKAAAKALNKYKGSEWLGNHSSGSDRVTKGAFGVDRKMLNLYKLFGAVDEERYSIKVGNKRAVHTFCEEKAFEIADKKSKCEREDIVICDVSDGQEPKVVARYVWEDGADGEKGKYFLRR